jgi:hypothetical protein
LIGVQPRRKIVPADLESCKLSFGLVTTQAVQTSQTDDEIPCHHAFDLPTWQQLRKNFECFVIAARIENRNECSSVREQEIRMTCGNHAATSWTKSIRGIFIFNRIWNGERNNLKSLSTLIACGLQDFPVLFQDLMIWMTDWRTQRTDRVA